MSTISNLQRAISSVSADKVPASRGSEGSSTGDRLGTSATGLNAYLSGPTTAERLLGMSSGSRDSAAAGSGERSVLQASMADLATQFASSPVALRAAVEQAFGDKLSPQEVNALVSRLVTGDLPALGNLEFVEAGALGENALGAYSAENGGTIYLNRRLLDNPELLQSVLAEEYGHHLDNVVGGGDSAGDEGEIFSSALFGGRLDTATLARLQSEQDHGFIMRDGQRMAVEFYSGGYSGPGSSPGTGATESTSDSWYSAGATSTAVASRTTNGVARARACACPAGQANPAMGTRQDSTRPSRIHDNQCT